MYNTVRLTIIVISECVLKIQVAVKMKLGSKFPSEILSSFFPVMLGEAC